MASVVLLVVALAAERWALQGLLQGRRNQRFEGRSAVRGRLAGRDILLVQAGIGRERARDAVVAAAREFNLAAAWSLGFACGLSERLQPGDLIFPAAVLDDADAGSNLRDGLKFHDGQPVRSADCIASVERWAKRDALSPNRSSPGRR